MSKYEKKDYTSPTSYSSSNIRVTVSARLTGSSCRCLLLSRYIFSRQPYPSRKPSPSVLTRWYICLWRFLVPEKHDTCDCEIPRLLCEIGQYKEYEIVSAWINLLQFRLPHVSSREVTGDARNTKVIWHVFIWENHLKYSIIFRIKKEPRNWTGRHRTK